MSNVEAITDTISTILTQVIKTAFSPENLESLLNKSARVVTQDPTGLAEQAVGDSINAITMTTPQSGTGAVDPVNLVNTGSHDPRPQHHFTSVSVPLSSRASSKIKAKIKN